MPHPQPDKKAFAFAEHGLNGDGTDMQSAYQSTKDILNNTAVEANAHYTCQRGFHREFVFKGTLETLLMPAAVVHIQRSTHYRSPVLVSSSL